MMKHMMALAALGFLAGGAAQAADISTPRSMKPAAALHASNPWEFQVQIGPGFYALYNPYGGAPGQHSAIGHGGIAGTATVSYRLNDWLAPVAGVRGFVSTAGRGRTLDASENVPGLGFITDTTRVTSSRMNAIGLMGGIQIGGNAFRLTPYAFIDSVRMKTRFENTFVVPGFVNLTDRFSTKLTTPVVGAGLKTQYFFTETFGLTADAFVGQISRKPKAQDSFGTDPDGRRVAVGGSLAVTAKF
jgi:hypothetical protein